MLLPGRLPAAVAPATVTAASPRADQPAASVPSGETAAPAATPPPKTVYIREYRVQGAHLLPKIEVEQAVYPFLGPGRTQHDVDQACDALVKAYEAKGFKTCTVQAPLQNARGGVIVLQVSEVPVGRLRVKGAHYFLPDEIMARAQSMAEGKVVNFNDVEREIVALNQLPDRKVSPSTHGASSRARLIST